MKIKVHIIPNAKKNELVSRDANFFGEEAWKIKINAAPVEGKANKELINFLSEHFKTAKSNIRILKGEKSRNKLIEIVD